MKSRLHTNLTQHTMATIAGIITLVIILLGSMVSVDTKNADNSFLVLSATCTHKYFFNGELIYMFNISFADGVHVTIFGEENMQVNSLSVSDVEFNNVANKAQTSETEFLRLCNMVNSRLGVEVL